MRKTVVAVMAVLMMVSLFATGASAAKLTRKKDSNGVYQVFNGNRQMTWIQLSNDEMAESGKSYGVNTIINSGNNVYFSFKEAWCRGCITIYFLDASTGGYAPIYSVVLDLSKKSTMNASGKKFTFTGRTTCENEICSIDDIKMVSAVIKNDSESSDMVRQAAENNGISLSDGVYAFLAGFNDKVVECPEEGMDDACSVGSVEQYYNVVFVDLNSHEEIGRVYFDKNKNMRLN